MKRRASALILCAAICTLSACGIKTGGGDYSSLPQEVISSAPAVETAKNPLTGLEIEKDKRSSRPVAVMINNIKNAQPVQTGLSSFDVLYETEVEGGITRMMGVVQDVSKLPQVGTVRSARYVYLDLALGHDAVYVHGGFDSRYFGSHKSELGVSTFDINGPDAAYGFRVKNGLATEHTLYTSGEKLDEGLTSRGYKRTTDRGDWLLFAAEDAPVTPATPCASVSVPFSQSYITGFKYDQSTGLYQKSSSGTVRTDYLTGQALSVTNVFVLLTDIYPYSDDYHMNVSLSGGKGYYISHGGYQEITWKKGSANTPLSFYGTDGAPITANAGKSYVCIMSSLRESGLKFE